jgi:hypothetical protein
MAENNFPHGLEVVKDGTAKFKVTEDGAMTAVSGAFSGPVSGTTGAFSALLSALGGVKHGVESIDATNDVTATDAQNLADIYILTAVATTGKALVLSKAAGRLVIVRNADADGIITVKNTSEDTGIAVAATKSAILFADTAATFQRLTADA